MFFFQGPDGDLMRYRTLEFPKSVLDALQVDEDNVIACSFDPETCTDFFLFFWNAREC